MLTQEQELRCMVCGSLNPTRLFLFGKREYVRCRQCRMIFLRLDADGKDPKAVYTTDAYQELQSQHRLYFREEVFNKSLDEIERVKAPGRMLDVGCGDGQFLKAAKKRGWETYGIEVSPIACRKAQAILYGNVICGDLRGGHFPDFYFDVVTFHNVLDHLPSPLDELHEAHRILKVGGLLILRLPNAVFHVNLLRMFKSLESQLVFHLYCFTPKTIKYLLEKAGYDRIRIQNSMLTPSDPYSASPMLGDQGMKAIKGAVYYVAQFLFYLSGKTLVIGPSLMIHAIKAREGERLG